MSKDTYICMVQNNKRDIQQLVEGLHNEFGDEINYVVQEVAHSKKVVKLFADKANMYLANLITQYVKGFRIGSNLDDGPQNLPTLLTLSDGKFMVVLGAQHWTLNDITTAVQMMKDLWQDIDV